MHLQNEINKGLEQKAQICTLKKGWGNLWEQQKELFAKEGRIKILYETNITSIERPDDGKEESEDFEMSLESRCKQNFSADGKAEEDKAYSQFESAMAKVIESLSN